MCGLNTYVFKHINCCVKILLNILNYNFRFDCDQLLFHIIVLSNKAIVLKMWQGMLFPTMPTRGIPRTVLSAVGPLIISSAKLVVTVQGSIRSVVNCCLCPSPWFFYDRVINNNYNYFRLSRTTCIHIFSVLHLIVNPSTLLGLFVCIKP